MANDKANSLLDAMSIIAEGVVKKYQYDQTIEAKIVSVARKDQGIYKCEYQNAIFDAYSNDTQSFYENETVYVNIPQGDFSKQKHIVGRKVDLEAAPDRTFNFRMPFDDFVGLESLTALAPFQGRKGFLANYPEHGGHQEVSAQYFDAVRPYNQQLAALDGEYQQQVTELANTVSALKTCLTTAYLSENWSLVIATAGTRLSLVKFDNNYNYLEILTADCEAGNINDLKAHFAAYKNARNAQPSLPVEIGSEDIKILTAAIDKYEKMRTESITAQWVSRRETIVNNLNNAVRTFTTNNYSHIWSWRNEDSKPKMLVETKLGLAIDIETNIGTYTPQAGEYGLRIVITGITKATEEESSTTKTVEYIWTNDEMYGNTYAFYTPYTQQKILDISAFLTLDQIDVFFYQNTDNIYSQGTVYINGHEQEQKIARNFLDINYDVIPYSYQDANGKSYLLPYNIYYNNLSVALGLTTDECSTDRVLLYTYDDVMFGEDPFATDSRITKDTRNLKFAWIHRTESGNIVLVDHAAKTNAQDIRALESYDAEIHWYHFEYGVAQDTTILAQKQGGVNWRFMDEAVDSNGRYWLFEQNVVPDIRKAKEKWKAIVTFNGVPYTSTPLVFTNIDTSVETSAADAINEVAFRILREGLDEQGNRVIIEDNSLTNFFVYDENGICIQNDENLTWSDLWFYIQVWIRNNDDGSYTPLPLAVEDDYNKALFEIEWQVPTTNTMLDQIQTVSNADLDNAVLAPTLESNIAGYNDAIRSCTRKFKIKHRWDMRAINNTIAAVVKRNGRIYKPQQEFTFGQSGSMGSPYTVTLRQTLPENGNMIQGEEFEVEANVFDSTGTQVSSRNFIFSWELLSPTIVTTGKLDPLTGLTWKSAFAALRPTSRQTSSNVNNVIHGVIRNAYPLILKVTVTGAADYPITQTIGFSLVDNQAVNSNYRINCPSKIEFKSDGKLPITVNSDFEVFMIQSGLTTRQVHPEWQLAQYLRIGDNWNQLPADQIKYIGLKNSTVADTTIVTNSNPVVYYNPDNYDAGFSLISTETLTTASTYGTLKNNIEIARNIENDENDSADENVGLEIEYRYRDRMNALNRAIGSLVPTYKSYALDPYVNYSAGSQVQWQWKDELANYYYTVIQFNYGANYFKQAIPFTRNVYSSSLLNSWDGTTQIDEANGAVLAEKISAGAKDRDNRFTGVIMGDWADKADNSLDTPGLYGLKYGEQVFGFKTDGTGFIGKSGKGRIEFDGNKSLISNSDKTCYLNLDPVIYTLNNNGSINGLSDYTGFSQYFLYAKTKKTSTASVDGEDSFDQSTYWAHDFMNDPANDYFIVDPNNGVLTTGGIIARYGKVGNWMISSAGLYQKYSQGTELTSKRYMYLGYPNLDKNKLAAIRQKYADLLVANERRRQQAIGSKNADFLWEEVGIIGDYYKAIFKLDPYHYFNAGWPLVRAADIIDDALDSYNEFVAALPPEKRTEIEALSFGSGSSNTFENKVYYTLLTDLQRVAKYVSVDDVFRRYHAHYTFNADGSVKKIDSDIDIYGLLSIWSSVFPIVEVTATRDMSRTDFQGNHRFGVPDTLSVIAKSSVVQRIYTPNNNYYGQDTENSAEVRAANVWSAQWPHYTKTQAMPQVVNAYDNTLSRDQLLIASEWLRGAYQYHLDGYTQQLAQMINAAIAAGELPETIQDAYNAAKARHEAELAEYIRTVINPLYDRLAANINSRMEKELQDEMINGDQNRYAIFAGYTPDTDPLFSVNWRGYMTARAGKIGKNSPWYITDYGLTQTNNFGTIFLGNPEAPADKTQWVDLGNDVNNLQLLPNHDETNSPLILGASEVVASRGKFAIYAGNKGYIWNYDQVLQKYTRSIEDSATIKFGVRMDGTLYAITGCIGGWHLTQNMLYAGDPIGNGDFVVLDANRGVINLNNAVILDKSGAVTLGTMVSDGQGGLVSSGTINIAGVVFKGRNSGHVNFAVPTYQLTAGGFGNDQISIGKPYNFWGSNLTIGDAVVSAGQGTTSITAAKKINFTALLDINDGAATSNGVIIGFGTEETNNNKAIAIYPSVESALTNSVLGTDKHRWDIIGDYVTCNTLDVTQGNISALNMFMGTDNALVATQKWVRDQLLDVYAAIQDAAQGGSDAGQRSYRGASSLANSITKKIQAILDFLKGKLFLDTYENTDGSSASTGALRWLYDGTSPYPRIAVSAKQVLEPSQESTFISDTIDPKDDKEGEVSNLGLATEDVILQSIVISEWAVQRGGIFTRYNDAKDTIASGLVKGFSCATAIIPTSFIQYDNSQFNGTKIKLRFGIQTDADSSNTYGYSCGAEIDLAHTHQPTITWDETNGTIKVEIGNANFQQTSLTTDDNQSTLKISTTSWFNARGIGTLYGKNKSGNDVAVAARAATSTQASQITSTKVYGTYNSEARTAAISVPLTLKALDNTTILVEGDLTVDAAQAYLKGWNDAAQSLSWYKSGSGIYVNRPRYYGDQVPTYGYSTIVKKIAGISTAVSETVDSTADASSGSNITVEYSGDAYAGSAYTYDGTKYQYIDEDDEEWTATSAQHHFYGSYSGSKAKYVRAYGYITIESDT